MELSQRRNWLQSWYYR